MTKQYDVGDYIECPQCGGGCNIKVYNNDSGDSTWNCYECSMIFDITCDPAQYKWEAPPSENL